MRKFAHNDSKTTRQFFPIPRHFGRKVFRAILRSELRDKAQYSPSLPNTRAMSQVSILLLLMAPRLKFSTCFNHKPHILLAKEMFLGSGNNPQTKSIFALNNWKSYIRLRSIGREPHSQETYVRRINAQPQKRLQLRLGKHCVSIGDEIRSIVRIVFVLSNHLMNGCPSDRLILRFCFFILFPFHYFSYCF